MTAVSLRIKAVASRAALCLIVLFLPPPSISLSVSPYTTSGLVSTADGAEDG